MTATSSTSVAQPFSVGVLRHDALRLRVAVLGMLMVFAAVLAGRIFDRFEWELPVAVALVVMIAELVHTLPGVWRAGALGGASAVAAFAAAFAATDDGGGLTAVLDGPRRLLTTEWPSPHDAAAIGTVVLTLAVLTAIACDMGYRPRWHLAPLIPATLAIVGVFALSAPLPPGWSTIALLGLGTLAYARSSVTAIAASRAARSRPTTRPRAGRPRGPRRSLRVRLATLSPAPGSRPLLVSAAAMLVIGVAVGSWLGYGTRADPRRVAPANTTASLLQSLESVVAVRQADPAFTWFTVDDRSNSLAEPLPTKWRLGAFDTYDGQRWTPTVAVRPIGGRLGNLEDAGSARPPVSYAITVRSAMASEVDGSPAATAGEGVIPFPGRPVSIDTDVLTDLSRVVVRTAQPARPGTTFQAAAERPPTVGEARDANVAQRPVDEIAATFTETALEIGGDGTALEQLQRMAATMSNEWRLDPSTSAGGQPVALLQRFADDTKRGTAEQFVGAFVLMARSLGYDARVAIGFDVPDDELSAPLQLRSTHTAVWPEVRFVDVGWLPFNPVPAAVTAESVEPPAPPEAQSPAAAQPPIAPPADRSDPTEDVDDTNETVDTGWAGWQVWVGRIALGAGLAVLPIMLYAGTILSIKALRRRRRRRAATAAACVRGAWANTTDSLVDAGLAIDRSWTDDHIAMHGADLAPAGQHEMRRLAALATSATFGPPVDHALAASALLTEAEVNTALTGDMTRRQRWRWRLSVRSLLPSTRSPVVV
ncbi:MAG TPA: transglutaminaseTgpA domain-containing protein [Ilumatobacter sp.]|nr:transglutaminaseTgpA domain-containing protein [Ilumatobacter sp.]